MLSTASVDDVKRMILIHHDKIKHWPNKTTWRRINAVSINFINFKKLTKTACDVRCISAVDRIAQTRDDRMNLVGQVILRIWGTKLRNITLAK